MTNKTKLLFENDSETVSHLITNIVIFMSSTSVMNSVFIEGFEDAFNDNYSNL